MKYFGKNNIRFVIGFEKWKSPNCMFRFFNITIERRSFWIPNKKVLNFEFVLFSFRVCFNILYGVAY